MADFVAVLRKTIDGLEHNTPEAREKVFAKARNAIDSKLASMNPPPPQVVADRQRKTLEDAIVAVRAEYEPPVEDDFEDFLGAFEAEAGDAGKSEADGAAVPVVPLAAGPAERVEGDVAPYGQEVPDESAPAPGFGDSEQPSEDSSDHAGPVFEPRNDAAAPVAADGEGVSGAGAASEETVGARRPVRPKRRRTGTLAIAAALILLIGAGAYAYWLNPDRVTALFGTTPAVESVATDGEATTDAAESATPEEETPAAEAAEAAPPVAADDPEKFTQRLLPDGSEVDEGPAGEQRRIGEGTSVASSTGTSDEQPASAPSSSAQVPVGQRAIFYEQTTSTAEGSAETGSVVWSLVQESPGGDAPPEPAIRGEVTIPGHSLQLRMTIRRNADQTLPAGHIMEMIFLTPENFAGGAIDSVLRVAMKNTEEETGNSLLGIPAKIADGFFLYALSDAAAEVETNLELMRGQSWIDVPIIYRSGRRALMTMEKGLTGERIFNEAIEAWQNQNSG